MVPTRWQAAILEVLQRQGRARISELARNLAVSEETIRRHVRPLVARGLLGREHGAVCWNGPGGEAPFDRRLRIRAAAKRAIARAAAGLVADGQTVMMDTGSTTAFVAEALAGRERLTLVTNGIEIARSLVGRNGHRVYLAGGELKAELAAAVGPEALAFIGQFRADFAILSIAAVDGEEGLMNYALDEARLARAMMARAERVVLVADQAKFGQRAAVHVARLEEIHTLVTDAPPPEPFAGRLAEAGITLVVAGDQAETTVSSSTMV